MMSMGCSSRISGLFLLVTLLARPTLQFTHYSEEPGSCELIGDTDVYGIGVRISFYLNWAAAFIALLFDLHEEHKGVRRAINAIAIAVITNTLINATKGSFANLEWYIVFALVLFLPLAVSIPFSWTAIKDDILGLSSLMLLYSIYLVIQPWIYFVIPRQGYKEGCPAKIFVYAPFNLYNTHWVRFTKAMAIISCVLGAFCTPVVCGIILYGLRSGWKKPAKAVNSQSSNNHHNGTNATNNSLADMREEMRKGIKAASIFIKIGFLFGGASTIAFIEETIRINHIDLSDAPLSSTGQLIPFIVGVFSLVAVMWTGIKEWRKKGSEEDQHASTQHSSSQHTQSQYTQSQHTQSQHSQSQHSQSQYAPLHQFPSHHVPAQQASSQQNTPLLWRNQW